MDGSNKELQYIPVVFITDNNFIMQTGVAIHSLKKSKDIGTHYHIYVVMAECDEKAKKEIMLTSSNDCLITIVEAGLAQYKDIKKISHIPIACLLKFNICDLIPEEDRLIYLDGDIIVKKDLSELYEFDLGDNIMAGVPSLDMIYDERRLINAGILVFDAKKMRDEKQAEKLIEKRRSLGDQGSMDQQTFNMMLSDRMAFLPLKYNVIPNKILGLEGTDYPIVSLNKLYRASYLKKKDIIEDAVILHYATGGKPWKYSFVVCAEDWYKMFKESPYRNAHISRKSALRAHFEGVINNLKKGGFTALINRAIYYIKQILGKNEHNTWG